MTDEAVKEVSEVLRRAATEIANQHREVMQGMTGREAADYVKRVIADASVMFGVYQDAGSHNGVGMYVIKGKRELQASIAAGLPIQIEVNAGPLHRSRTGHRGRGRIRRWADQERWIITALREGAYASSHCSMCPVPFCCQVI
jgi:hypothetical protein